MFQSDRYLPRAGCLVIFCASGVLSALAATSAVAATTGAPESLEEIIVTATLRARPATDLTASAVVLDAATLRDAGQQHLADVLGLIPNLNFAGGSSRPRYFQVRGIGELEQYEGAPNPSVGFLIDGMDFSGIGMAATLFDVHQVEVLRGPQGARYGANALGGLINITSTAPAATSQASVSATLGSDHTQGAGGVVNLAWPAADSTFRLGVQRQRSDGFRHNAFLGRSDTNGRDELTTRARWRWQPAADATFDLTLLHVELDNRYDAFAIDNTRTTLSDHPGQDAQHATGLAATWQAPGPGTTRWSLTGAYVDSASVHAYDGDWGNAASWAPYTYDYLYHADRGRQTATAEARLESASSGRLSWLVGVWHQQLREQITESSRGTYADPAYPEVFTSDSAGASRYHAATTAFFGETELQLAPTWQASLGLRYEHRDTRFSTAQTDLAPRDSQVGGHFTLSHTLAKHGLTWLSATRGFKAGGINPSPQLPTRLREFGEETVSGLELGARQNWSEGRWQAELVLFDLHRQHLQVRTSEQLVIGDPNTFVFYTDNAARGRHRGAEASLRWRPSATLDTGVSVGWLRATLNGIVRDGVTLPARDAPHAPHWQFATHVAWHGVQGWFARLDLTGMDAFYFGNLPEPYRSQAYALTHLRAGWEGQHLSVDLYVRNALNRRYTTRGFAFGNEPPDFPEKSYVQVGDPREGGLNLQWRF